MTACAGAVALSVVVLLVVAVAPAEAQRRPGAPSKTTVARAVAAVPGATPFGAGKRVARRARKALKRRRSCAAAQLLGRHHTLTDRRLRTAKRRRARATIARLKAGDRRAVKARALILRSLAVGKACGGAPAVAVDATVKPDASLPPIGGSGPRPVARVVDAYGNAVDFVANELLVIGTEADVQALVGRWNGRILATHDLTRLGGGERAFLIRIDVSKADETRLSADLAALSKTRGTVASVSSEQGLDAIAAAAREARGGSDTVGLNIIGEGNSLASGSTREGGNGPDGFAVGQAGWSTNAFDWKHLSTAPPQAIGTAAAWQLLARAGRTENKVDIAILDMGFTVVPQAGDFGEPLAAESNVPFVDVLEESNGSDCGSPCPWHGTNVANTAFAVVDNGFGVAGTGGPVARRKVIYTSYDFFTVIGALITAGDATVANMSFGARVPAALSWTVLPFELATKLAETTGTLLIAAAGNDNTNVDDTDCFLVCWEEAWWTPCENAGVLCVGALERDATTRASYSNYGKRDGQVELFAPGTVLVGRDLATPDSFGASGVHPVSGTSFAAPYLAGVAALVKAANPDLSIGDIESTLRRTAYTSTDKNVGRYVNALAAVRSVLPRLVNIEAPVEASSISKGGNVELSAFVHDPDGGNNTVDWTVVGGEPLGTGERINVPRPPYGTHRIRATLRFTNITDEVTVHITNDDPIVRIRQPTAGATFVEGETVPMLGDSEDRNQPESGGRLRDDQLSWFLDSSSTPFGTGTRPSLDLTGVSAGPHTITLRGIDDAGAIAMASVGIDVEEAAPSNQPPSVAITSPANNSVHQICSGCQDGEGYYALVTFQSDATDPDGDPLTFEWEEAYPGTAFPPTVRFTVEDPGEQKVYFKGCGEQGHDFTLTVADGTYTRTSSVHIGLDVVC